MCLHRTKLYKACGHTEFRRFVCNPVPISNNDDQMELDSNGPVYVKGRFACGESPQYVNDLEVGFCGHCRRRRYPNKGAGRRRAVLDQEQSHGRVRVQDFSPGRYADELNDGGKRREQPTVQIFVSDPEAREPDRGEKPEDIEERCLFKKNIIGPVEKCRQVCEEMQEDQPKASSSLDAIGSMSEYRPMSDKSEPAAIITDNENSTRSRRANDAPGHAQPPNAYHHTLSHSATKVRRDIYAAKGRVRSMIQAINGRSDVSRMINPLDNKSMVASMIKTINRHSESQRPAKSGVPVAPKKKESTNWPLPPPLYPNPQALPKLAKLQILTRHQYHRLVPLAEDPTSQSLVVTTSVANTVVLRRAKAIKVRNLNAFHCPLRQPRFGLKRKVLAPPVPRHSTPPVAVPCSKFAHLGRRRVSDLEWCFVI